MALKYIMKRYAKNMIPSKLLTWRQDLAFVESLKVKLPNIKRIELLFRASEHNINLSAHKFHRACDNKGATITIIKSNHDNIFGGYTSKSWKSPPNIGPSWKSNYEYVTDEKAFLFLIKSNLEKYDKKCPLFFDIKKGEKKHAIRCDRSCGPIFGGESCDIFLTNASGGYSTKHCYDYGQFDESLCGNYTKLQHWNYYNRTQNDTFDPVDYEVFKCVFT